MRRLAEKASQCTKIVQFIFSVGVFKFFDSKTLGFTINQNVNTPSFSSMPDLRHTFLNGGMKHGIPPESSTWQKLKNAELFHEAANPIVGEVFDHERRRLQFQDSKVTKGPFSKKLVHNPRNGRKKELVTNPPVHRSRLNELIIRPSVQFWSKRDVKSQIVPRSTGSDNKRKEKFAMMDRNLENLQPDKACTNSLGLCAKMPLKNLECIIHCHLSTHVLEQSSTKFLFRLLKVYSTYPKLLCPTFGEIYNEIPNLIGKENRGNTLLEFLSSVGIVSEAPVNVDFIKIAPSSLFNNLVKFAEGEDIDLVKPILTTAETAAAAELSEQNLFPSIYGNPLCKLDPKEGWFVSMIDTMTKHPTTTDILLRGFWVLTRALNIDLQYPVDSLFVSMVFSIKLLAGVDCSIIAYAEQGKPFKCRQPPPVDKILNSYTKDAREVDEDNSYSWLVCGAHQVEIPDWIQFREGLLGRSDATGLKNRNQTSNSDTEALGDDLSTFPNPDELYPLEKS